MRRTLHVLVTRDQVLPVATLETYDFIIWQEDDVRVCAMEFCTAGQVSGKNWSRGLRSVEKVCELEDLGIESRWLATFTFRWGHFFGNAFIKVELFHLCVG